MRYIIIFIIAILMLYSICFAIHHNEEDITYSFDRVVNRRTNNKEDFIIPRNIIQSFSSRYVTVGMRKNINSWMEMNKEYSYTYFDEEEMVNFIEDNYSEKYIRTFYKINAGAGRADFFRYLYLYKNGGVWIDVTIVPYISLREFIKNDTEMVLVHDVECNNIYNALMGFPSGHELLKKCIKKCMSNVNEEKFKPLGRNCIYHTTGPEMMMMEYDNYKKNNSGEKTVILRKSLSLKGNITKIIKEIDVYNCFYISLDDKKIMKTKFDRAKENLEFIARKKHYKKIGFFNNNIKFIDGMLEIRKLSSKIVSDKGTTLLIKSSSNLDSIKNFERCLEIEKISEICNIVIIDDFSETDELIETYKKLSRMGVQVKINSIRRENFFLLESLNSIPHSSENILLMERETYIKKSELEKILRENDREKMKVQKYFDQLCIYFGHTMLDHVSNLFQKSIVSGSSIEMEFENSSTTTTSH